MTARAIVRGAVLPARGFAYWVRAVAQSRVSSAVLKPSGIVIAVGAGLCRVAYFTGAATELIAAIIRDQEIFESRLLRVPLELLREGSPVAVHLGVAEYCCHPDCAPVHARENGALLPPCVDERGEPLRSLLARGVLPNKIRNASFCTSCSAVLTELPNACCSLCGADSGFTVPLAHMARGWMAEYSSKGFRTFECPNCGDLLLVPGLNHCPRCGSREIRPNAIAIAERRRAAPVFNGLSCLS